MLGLQVKFNVTTPPSSLDILRLPSSYSSRAEELPQTAWPAKLKIITSWPFTENACAPLRLIPARCMPINHPCYLCCAPGPVCPGSCGPSGMASAADVTTVPLLHVRRRGRPEAPWEALPMQAPGAVDGHLPCLHLPDEHVGRRG